MDLDLPAEHALLRDTVRDFMLTEVAPVIEEHERERRFPIDIVRRIGELGWLGIPIPEDEGGAGLDTLAYAVAVEEIGAGLGLARAHRRRPHLPRLRPAPPGRARHEQQQRYLVPMARARSSAPMG